MSNRSFAPAGVFAIAIACIVTSAIITEVTGMYSHWPLVVAGLIVGFMSLSAIR